MCFEEVGRGVATQFVTVGGLRVGKQRQGFKVTQKVGETQLDPVSATAMSAIVA